MQQESPERFCRKDYKQICKKHRSFPKDYEQALRVVTAYLKNPSLVDEPRGLHRLTANEDYTLWKLGGVMIKGLRPGQWPRLWFAVIEDPCPCLVPLELRMHGDGYQDNQVEASALALIEENLYFLREELEGGCP